MLNRRQLRIKVLQAVYAYFQSKNDDLAKGEKEMFHSINKIYDLYLHILLIFQELRDFSEKKIEEGKKKRLPSEEDLKPNTKFLENKALNILADSDRLKEAREKRKLGWENQQEMLNRIFKEIRESGEFKSYLNSEENSFKQDVKVLTDLFRNHVANSELLYNYFEASSIFWMDDLDLVCNMVIKTIKGLDENSEEVKLFSLYKDEKEDKEFARTMFRKVQVHHAEHRKLIGEKAKNWEMDRIALMDLLLMELAVTEIREFPQIPVKVSFNEYIEISKFYSTPKSNTFINGILDKAVAELTEKGKVKKVGRGLLNN